MNRKIILAFLLTLVMVLGLASAANAVTIVKACYYYLPGVEGYIHLNDMPSSGALLTLNEVKSLDGTGDYFNTIAADYALRWRVTPASGDTTDDKSMTALYKPGDTVDFTKHANESGVFITAVLGFEVTIDPDIEEDDSDVYVDFVEAQHYNTNVWDTSILYTLPAAPESEKEFYAWRRNTDGALCYLEDTPSISDNNVTFTAFYKPETTAQLVVTGNFVDEDADITSAVVHVDYYYNGESDALSSWSTNKKLTTADNVFTSGSDLPINQEDSRYPITYKVYVESSWISGYDPENTTVPYVTGTIDPRDGTTIQETINIEMLRSSVSLTLDQVDDITAHEFDITLRLWNNAGTTGYVTNRSYSDIDFDSNGEAVVKMKDGQTITFDDLPSSTSLSVEVPDMYGYEYTYSMNNGTATEIDASNSFSTGLLWNQENRSASMTLYADYTETYHDIYLTALPDGDTTLAADRLSYEVTLRDYAGEPITTLTTPYETYTADSETGVITIDGQSFSASPFTTLQDIPYGASYTITPKADDYTFKEATTDAATVNGTVGSDSSIDIFFYSDYTGQLYTVYLKDENGDVELLTYPLRAGAYLTLPTTTNTSPYYNFLGWKDSEGEIYFVGEDYQVTGDATLTEVWQYTTNVWFELGDKLSPLVPASDQFTVMIALKDQNNAPVSGTYGETTFSSGMARVTLSSDPNDNDLTLTDVPTYYQMQAIIILPNETYYTPGSNLGDDYYGSFSGYNSEIVTIGEDGVTIDFGCTYSGTATVTFSGGDGATGNAPESITLTAEDYTFTIPGQGDLAKENCTFSGWQDITGTYGGTFTEGEEVNTIYADTTLTAVWEGSGEGGNEQEPDDSDYLWLWGDVSDVNAYSYDSTPADINASSNESFYAYNAITTDNSPYFTVLVNSEEILTKSGIWNAAIITVEDIQAAVTDYEADNNLESGSVTQVTLELTMINAEDTEDETYKASATVTLPSESSGGDDSEVTDPYLYIEADEGGGNAYSYNDTPLAITASSSQYYYAYAKNGAGDSYAPYWTVLYGDQVVMTQEGNWEEYITCGNIVDAVSEYETNNSISDGTITQVTLELTRITNETESEDYKAVIKLTIPRESSSAHTVTLTAMKDGSAVSDTTFAPTDNVEFTASIEPAVEGVIWKWEIIGDNGFDNGNGELFPEDQADKWWNADDYAVGDNTLSVSELQQMDADETDWSVTVYAYGADGTELSSGSTRVTIQSEEDPDEPVVDPNAPRLEVNGDRQYEGVVGESLTMSITAYNVSSGYEIVWDYDEGMPMSLEYTQSKDMFEAAVFAETENEDGSITSTLTYDSLALEYSGTYFVALYDADGNQYGGELLTLTVSEASSDEPAGSGNNVLVDPTQENSESNPNPKEIDVTGILKSNKDVNEPTIYSVELHWGAMAFQYSYTTTTTREWDAVNHTWTVIDTADSDGTWELLSEDALPLNDDADDIFPDADQSYVVVFNHSNARLGVDMTNTAADTTYNVTSALKEVTGGVGAESANDAAHTYTLGKGIEGEVYNAATGTAAKIELSGTPDTGISSDKAAPSTVARLTVIFSKVD